MKKLRKLFRHFGEADKNIWGYVMLLAFIPLLREKVVFSFQDVSLVFKVMRKKIMDSIQTSLAEVGRNEMLMMGYTIKK